jgi:anti-sigma factor RsiW
MTCREAFDFLSDYMAGDLPHDVRASFERHLDRCGNCRTLLAQFRATVQAARIAAAADPPPVPDELVAAILRAVS